MKSDTQVVVCSLIIFSSFLLGVSSQNISESYIWKELYEDYTFPLLISLVSAFIFWLIFSYFPLRKRYKHIRPRVEYNLFKTYQILFRYFDLLLKNREFSPSIFQNEIVSGNLLEKDFFLGLQNKCLRESDKYDPNVKNHLMAIGESIVDIYGELEETIDRTLVFNEELEPEEIVLLEKIRYLVKTYNLNDKTINKPEKVRLMVTNISHLSRNTYQVYELFKELQKKVFLENSFLDRDVFLRKIKYLYEMGLFRNCIVYIQKYQTRFEKEAPYIQYYLVLCKLRLGKKEIGEEIEKVFKKRFYNGNLASSRSFIRALEERFPCVEELLKKYYTDEEIGSYRRVVKEEAKQKELFLENQKELLKYFAKLDFRLKDKLKDY